MGIVSLSVKSLKNICRTEPEIIPVQFVLFGRCWRDQNRIFDACAQLQEEQNNDKAKQFPALGTMVAASSADISRSKLKCRRRHEQDHRVTCVNSFVSFATFVCFSHGSKDHETHCRNRLYFEFWEYLKNYGQKSFREAMFVLFYLAPY